MSFLTNLMRKDSPTVQSVHISSALGNDRYAAALARRKAKRKVTKGADVAVNFVVPITKLQEDKNRVFGWANVADKDGEPVLDLQEDWMTEGDLEEALYDFAKNARTADEMHDGSTVGEMIECMAFTKEKQEVLGIDLGRTGAWIGFELTPAVFAKVKSGEYRSFSVGGSGRRIPG